MAGHTPFNVQKLAGQRLHTRTIVRDRRQAFVGSQSLRTAELDARRELGLIGASMTHNRPADRHVGDHPPRRREKSWPLL
jgi:hypothetical protein